MKPPSQKVVCVRINSLWAKSWVVTLVYLRYFLCLSLSVFERNFRGRTNGLIAIVFERINQWERMAAAAKRKTFYRVRTKERQFRNSLTVWRVQISTRILKGKSWSQGKLIEVESLKVISCFISKEFQPVHVSFYKKFRIWVSTETFWNYQILRSRSFLRVSRSLKQSFLKPFLLDIT